MTRHEQKHSGSERHSKSDAAMFSRRVLYKDWRVWLVVVLMLAAIGMYVLTLDDSAIPAIIRN